MGKTVGTGVHTCLLALASASLGSLRSWVSGSDGPGRVLRRGRQRVTFRGARWAEHVGGLGLAEQGLSRWREVGRRKGSRVREGRLPHSSRAVPGTSHGRSAGGSVLQPHVSFVGREAGCLQLLPICRVPLAVPARGPRSRDPVPADLAVRTQRRGVTWGAAWHLCPTAVRKLRKRG